MRNTQDNDDKREQKRTVRKGAKVKSSGDAAFNSLELQQESDPQRPMHTTCSSVKHVMTEDEFRARVAQKAYELYERRARITELDDWLEAERLVKRELLAEVQCAGSV